MSAAETPRRQLLRRGVKTKKKRLPEEASLDATATVELVGDVSDEELEAAFSLPEHERAGLVIARRYDPNQTAPRVAVTDVSPSYDLYPLDAPGMPAPGKDLKELAEALGDDTVVVGKGAKEEVTHSGTVLQALYRQLLYASGNVSVPISVTAHDKVDLAVVTGHRWLSDVVTGPVPSNVMVVGKMLGEEEKHQGRGYVGPTGELLQDSLDALGSTREEYGQWYMTNLIKTEHPRAATGESTLKSGWIKEWLPVLHQELRIVRPRYILCLGADSLKALLGKRATLKGMEGRVVELCYPISRTTEGAIVYHTALVMACTHPAAVLRAPEQTDMFENGLARFLQLSRGLRPDKEEEDLDHRQIDSLEELIELYHEICADNPGNLLSCDAEWHGEHPQNEGAYLRMIQLSWKHKSAVCIHVTHPGGKWRFQGSKKDLCKWIKKICRGRRLAGHFFTSDLEWLVDFGIDLRKEFAVAETWQEAREQALRKHKPVGGFDTGLALHSVDETADFSLTSATLRYTSAPRYDVELVKWRDDFCSEHKLKKDDLEGYGECPDSVLAPYGCYDADVTRRLVVTLQKQLDCDRFGNNCWEAFWISMRAQPIALEISRSGLRIDRDRLDGLTETYLKAKARLGEGIRKLARWNGPDEKNVFNLNSVFQMREFLFGEELNGKERPDPFGPPVRLRPKGAVSLRLTPIMTTDKRPMPWSEVVQKGLENEKTPSTNKIALAILAQENQEVLRWSESRQRQVKVDFSVPVNQVRDYRFISQVLRQTLRPPVEDDEGEFIVEDGHYAYEAGLPASICDDGKVRTHIYQTKETGRWASARPPLMNLSKRRESDYARILAESYKAPIRTIIRADEGELLIEADFTGAELFGMALLSGDEKMIEHALRNQLPETHPDFYDIHSNVAVRAFRLDCEPTKGGLKSISKAHLRIVAKCVTGGTRIQTSGGWLRVDALAGGLLENTSELYEGPAVQLTSHGRSTPLLAVTNSGSKACLQIETVRGHRLTCSRGHRLLVMSEAGELVFRKASQISPDDWVCLQGRPGQFGKRTAFPRVQVRSRTCHKRFEFPKRFDEHWAGLLGLYLAEGSVTGRQLQINLACEGENEDCVAAQKLLRGVFGDRLIETDVPYKHYQDQVKFAVSSVDVATWFKTFVPGDSHSKRLPEFVYQWPKRLQAALLRWLFAGDGSVKKNGNGFAVGYSTASEELARGVALLLSNFGIETSISSETREGYDGTYWSVNVFSNASRETFRDEIGCVSTADALLFDRQGVYQADRRVIPHQLERLRRIMPFVPSPVKEKCRECLRERSRVALSPSRLELILAAFDKQAADKKALQAFAELQELSARSISFQRVRKVSDAGRQPVFDVTTTAEERHVVCYDQFFTHQSVIFGVAYGRGAKAIALAVKEEGVYITVDEAQQIIDAIFELYPGLRPFFESCQSRALRERWICNCFGRFRRFPLARDKMTQGDFERQAMNFPIQSMIADAVSRAADNLWRYREETGLPFRFLLQIHDALLFGVPIRHVPQFIDEALPRCMVDEVTIFPTDLSGRPIDGEPRNLSIGIDPYIWWGEDLEPHDCLRIGLDPKYAHWHAQEDGFIHPEKPGKIWRGDVNGGTLCTMN